MAIKSIATMIQDLSNKQHIYRGDVLQIAKAVAKDGYLSQDEQADLDLITPELEKKMSDGARQALLNLLSVPGLLGRSYVPQLGKNGVRGGYLRDGKGIGHVVFGQMKNGVRDGLWSNIDLRRNQTFTFYRQGKPEDVTLNEIRFNEDGRRLMAVSHDIINGAGATEHTVFAYVIIGKDGAPTKTVTYEEALAAQLAKSVGAREKLLGKGAKVTDVSYNGEFDCTQITWIDDKGQEQTMIQPSDRIIAAIGTPDVE